MQSVSNHVLFREQKICYWIYGDQNSSNNPLLVVHGGPGSPHNYLLPLAKLANERVVIFYDQLGCGKSPYVGLGKSSWALDYFVDELIHLITTLKLDKFHLFGHSWGTILAIEYALKKQETLKSLILASPCLSLSLWSKDAEKLLAELPRKTRETLKKHQILGTTNSDEYQIATMDFYQQHVCRLPVWPQHMMDSVYGSNDQVYKTIWGESEFLVTGNIKNYNITHRLNEIAIPTLFTCGRYDEATPETTTIYKDAIKGSEIKIFEKSSHLPHFEEQYKYVQEIAEFLRLSL